MIISRLANCSVSVYSRISVYVQSHSLITYIYFDSAEEQAEQYRSSFRVVCQEKGPERRTPNEHDFILYSSIPGTIKTSAPNSHPLVERMDVPQVPGAFLLKNVLSAAECDQVLSASEAIGYTPDVPIVGAASESVSVLAHNFFWLVDDDFLGTIFDRCRPHFPKEIGGGAVMGVNARWRVYRYVPGAIYRVSLFI